MPAGSKIAQATSELFQKKAKKQHAVVWLTTGYIRYPASPACRSWSCTSVSTRSWPGDRFPLCMTLLRQSIKTPMYDVSLLQEGEFRILSFDPQSRNISFLENLLVLLVDRFERFPNGSMLFNELLQRRRLFVRPWLWRLAALKDPKVSTAPLSQSVDSCSSPLEWLMSRRIRRESSSSGIGKRSSEVYLLVSWWAERPSLLEGPPSASSGEAKGGWGAPRELCWCLQHVSTLFYYARNGLLTGRR